MILQLQPQEGVQKSLGSSVCFLFRRRFGRRLFGGRLGGRFANAGTSDQGSHAITSPVGIDAFYKLPKRTAATWRFMVAPRSRGADAIITPTFDAHLTDSFRTVLYGAASTSVSDFGALSI